MRAAAQQLSPGAGYSVAGVELSGMPALGACPLSAAGAPACALRCWALQGCMGYVWSPPSAATCPGTCRLLSGWGEWTRPEGLPRGLVALCVHPWAP
jgi:hypothetical protein